eukprot:5584369-Lingulodinium_polyedra.AAC.1
MVDTAASVYEFERAAPASVRGSWSRRSRGSTAPPDGTAARARRRGPGHGGASPYWPARGT